METKRTKTLKNLALTLLSMFIFSSGLFAQDPCEQKYGPDSIKTLENLSVYAEFYKQKDYNSAYDAWKYVFDNAPCASQNVHIRGTSLLKQLIKAEENEERKARLEDTLFMIYDVRAKLFPGKEGNDFGRKAIDMMSYDVPADEVLPVFEQSISYGNNVPYFVPSRYFTLALKEKYKSEEMTKEEVVDLYTKLFKIVNANIESGSKYADKYEASLANMTANLSGTVTKTCEDVITYFGSMYEENPDDEQVQDLIYKLLLSKKCTDLPLFEEILTKRVETNPTAKAAYALGLKMSDKKKHSDAIKYLKLAVDLEEADTTKADYILALASAYKSSGSFSQARSKALEAANAKPNWGDPYIFLGDLYASSARSCGDDKLGPGVVYWLAVDMYAKARSIDPSVATKAGQRIGKYSGSFPDKERLFFNQMQEGDSYTIGCWIQRTTTVRASK